MGRHESKRHVYLDEAYRQSVGTTILLPESKAIHLRKVLRVEKGQIIHVTDGHGRLFEAVFEIDGRGASATLSQLVRTDPRPPETVLVVGMAKNATMDLIVEKAVECGASRLISVEMNRSVVKVADASKYTKRWTAIAQAALEQSERTWEMKVNNPVRWNEFLRTAELTGFNVKVACISETRDVISDTRDALTNFWSRLEVSPDASIAIFVGPEGGITSEEKAALEALGFSPVSLGKQVLRVETAVIAALWSIVLRRALR